MPEKIGDASLVPPKMCQPARTGSGEGEVDHAPPSTAALIEMSGVPRLLPTTSATPVW